MKLKFCLVSVAIVLIVALEIFFISFLLMEHNYWESHSFPFMNDDKRQTANFGLVLMGVISIIPVVFLLCVAYAYLSHLLEKKTSVIIKDQG